MVPSHLNPVLSRPCRVHWAGFESDTYRLQQQGWQIAADQDVQRGRISLMLRHRDLRLYAVSLYSDYNFFNSSVSGQPDPVFRIVQALPEHTQIHTTSGVDFSRFSEVDASPQINAITYITRLDDYKIFATPLARTEEIIVEPQDVAEMLEQIRKMQSPEQAAIRKRRQSSDRQGEASERQRFHAQILSFERAA